MRDTELHYLNDLPKRPDGLDRPFMTSLDARANDNMPPCRTLCILTTLLGNKPTAMRLMEALQGLEWIEPTFVLVTMDDYKTHPAPLWAKLSNAWEARSVARRKVGPLLGQQFDALLVNCWEYVVEFQDLARRLPAAALMDAVPANVNTQLIHRSQGGWRRSLAHWLQDGPFKRAARHFRFFLPTGSDTIASLERDYGIPRERCFATLQPQDLNVWAPVPHVYSRPLRLLFVGNDFLRKGGDFLLRLYAEHLSDDFVLTIASRDPGLERRPLPKGVTWLRDRDRDQLIEVYRAADLFILPTQQDFMPQVLAEALSTGVPCMANDVGGIREMVRDGETGFLIPPDASMEAWAERLRYLSSHPGELSRMAANARRFAEANLGMDRFRGLVSNVMQRLCGGERNGL